MGANMYHKKYIEKLINTNPVNITIKRKAETDDGFGGTIITETEANETVSFYKKSSSRQTVNESGIVVGYMASKTDKILAYGDADILEGDVFQANGRKYKVLFVNNYFDICKQIELEVIE